MDFQTEKIKIAQLVLGTEHPEIIQSIKNLDISLTAIAKHPERFPESERVKGLRKYDVTKHDTLFYRFDLNNNYILTIFDTSQNLNKSNEDLK